ncbi:cytochrome P450 71A1-like [Panicum miliaceum]|uniref:Cytochrome P450 71A1-like n=1 Tax=Panicum miliaceum TaxID=4540 RepID=A0A3L6TFJ1_PANMI|nr:cytochrome P450 71A1-like [Panicum miliaceum]
MAPFVTALSRTQMELPPPWASSSLGAVLATALLLLVTVLRRRRSSTSKYNLPPGPRPWPVTGNLHLIGSLPHRSLHALSARHGPLMSLRFGSVPVVVASSVDAARFVLRIHDAAFIDRPRMASGRYTAYDFSDIVWSPYGAYWRQARKLWQTKLFSARQLRSQEHVRVEELRGMLLHLHRGLTSPPPPAGRGAVVLKEHLLMLSLNVISRMALGRKYVGDGEDAAGSPVSPGEFRWMVDELFVLNGVLSVGDFFPWLRWLEPQGYIRRMKRLARMFDRFLEHVVDEHNERRRREGEEFVATDMVDLLLELADDPTLEVPIERDGVKGFVLVRQEGY